MSDIDSDEEWDLAAKALESLQIEEGINQGATKGAIVESNDNEQEGKTESRQQPSPSTSSGSRAVEIFSKLLGKPAALAPTPGSGKKILVLLDMNGVLLCRSPEKIKGQARSFDCKVVNNFCYIRSGANDLVSWLAACPAVDLSFYTSMKKKSAGPLAEFVMGKEDKTIHLYDQPFNKKDPDGEKPWSMMRDLPKLWSLKDTPAYNHSEKTTIMIDDSYAKMREYPDNVLLVPEYTAEIIECGEINDEKVLRTTIKFMNELTQAWNSLINNGESNDKDIRELIRPLRERYIF